MGKAVTKAVDSLHIKMIAATFRGEDGCDLGQVSVFGAGTDLGFPIHYVCSIDEFIAFRFRWSRI